MTEQEKLAREQAIAKLMMDLVDPNAGYSALKATVEGLVKFQDSCKGLDATKILAEFERIKAVQEALSKMIKGSKRGFHVPGTEDQDFSMLKAMLGVRMGWKEAGAEKEYDILKAVRAKAAQQIGDDKLGGFFVPDQVIPDVIGAIYARSVFVNLVGEGTQRISVLEGLVGGNVKIPKFDGGLVAYWIGEEDEYAESQTEVGDVTMNPKKMGILVRLTDSMKKFAGYGFENLLRRDMERAAAAKLDWTIAYGRGGDNMPRGIMNTPSVRLWCAETGALIDNTAAAIAAHTDWDGGELDFDGLDNMMLALEEDNIALDASAAIISSPRYFRRLKQLKVENYSAQTSKNPYLLGMPILPDSKLAEVIGPFDKSTQIPSNSLPGASIGAPTDSTNSKYTDVILGNLDTVVLGRWAGIEIEDDAGKGKGFTSDHTYVKLRMYADVAVRQGRELIVSPDVKAR